MSDANVIPDMIADPSAFEDDAEFRLKAAQAAIRRECGWHVMPNTELSGVLNSRGGMVIRLPARHVTSIESLTDRDGNKLAYAYDPETGLVESCPVASPPESRPSATRFMLAMMTRRTCSRCLSAPRNVPA